MKEMHRIWMRIDYSHVLIRGKQGSHILRGMRQYGDNKMAHGKTSYMSFALLKTGV